MGRKTQKGRQLLSAHADSFQAQFGEQATPEGQGAGDSSHRNYFEMSDGTHKPLMKMDEQEMEAIVASDPGCKMLKSMQRRARPSHPQVQASLARLQPLADEIMRVRRMETGKAHKMSALLIDFGNGLLDVHLIRWIDLPAVRLLFPVI